MIDVRFIRKDGKLVSFIVEGHAGFAEYNNDIVCSAVSVLAYAIINGVTDVLKLDAEYEVNEGYAKLELAALSSEQIEKCQVLMETMLLQIKSLLENYGKYIKLKVEEV